MLDAEKLHVYRLAVQLQTLAARLVPRQRGVLLATLRDQGALLDLLLARGLIGRPVYGEARALIVRIVQMPTQLGARMATFSNNDPSRVRERLSLRKDEIERAIVAFLRTGTVNLPTKRALRKTGAKDLERGL